MFKIPNKLMAVATTGGEMLARVLKKQTRTFHRFAMVDSTVSEREGCSQFLSSEKKEEEAVGRETENKIKKTRFNGRVLLLERLSQV